MTFLHSGYTPQINLSAKEMFEISQEISRDFTPCFSSRMPKRVEKIKFSARELFDISEEIGRDFAPKVSGNLPELMLLPIAPGHIHAYWNIGQNQVATPDNSGAHPLTLRIYGQAEETMATGSAASWFDVSLDKSENQQHVSLPISANPIAYSAAIGQTGMDDNFIVLARSNTVYPPHSRMNPRQALENQAACQSKNASGQGADKPA